MKVQDFSFSNKLRRETSFMDFVTELRNILNYGRYQMRISTTVPTWTGQDGEHLIYISGTIRRFYWYDETNSTWHYTEWNGSGLGSPSITKTIALTGQTASIGATTIYTAPAVGLYRASVYQLCTKSGASGTLDTTISWVDDSQAQSLTPAAQVNLTGVGNGGTGDVFIRSTATAIKYATTVNGEAGAPEYGLWLSLEKIV